MVRGEWQGMRILSYNLNFKYDCQQTAGSWKIIIIIIAAVTAAAWKT